jgi:hypothetical protein
MIPDPSPPKRELTPNQRAMVASGYIPTIEQSVKEQCAPLWWYDPRVPTGTRPIKGATVCFVHTGKRLLGITAAHVHLECASILKRDPGIACQLGAHTFDPDRCLLAIDEHWDLAVYGLSELQVNATGARIHHAPEWPPVVADGDGYVIGGWVWSLSEDRGNNATHYFLHFIAGLKTRSENQLGIVTGTSTSIPWGNHPLPSGTNLGGMSGGPVYRVSERAGLVKMMLVGIVFEYQPSYEIAFARPLSLIDEQGAISPSRL